MNRARSKSRHRSNTHKINQLKDSAEGMIQDLPAAFQHQLLANSHTSPIPDGGGFPPDNVQEIALASALTQFVNQIAPPGSPSNSARYMRLSELLDEHSQIALRHRVCSRSG
jgi:hypothetical protein